MRNAVTDRAYRVSAAETAEKLMSANVGSASMRVSLTGFSVQSLLGPQKIQQWDVLLQHTSRNAFGAYRANVSSWQRLGRFTKFVRLQVEIA
jgi:hypothetical protein